MRITGGRFRSRLLASPRGDATRPTSDRVREALFSMLEARGGFADARVLDLYAGTGALGLEAISRDASHVTFVERRREALVALRANIESLGVAAQTRIVARAVESAAPELTPPFDVVFADPPYADVQSGAALRALARIMSARSPNAPCELLREGALIVLEHASKTPAPLPSMLGLRGAVLETRAYGDTQLTFYRATLTDANDGG